MGRQQRHEHDLHVRPGVFVQSGQSITLSVTSLSLAWLDEWITECDCERNGCSGSCDFFVVRLDTDVRFIPGSIRAGIAPSG